MVLLTWTLRRGGGLLYGVHSQDQGSPPGTSAKQRRRGAEGQRPRQRSRRQEPTSPARTARALRASPPRPPPGLVPRPPSLTRAPPARARWTRPRGRCGRPGGQGPPGAARPDSRAGTHSLVVLLCHRARSPLPGRRTGLSGWDSTPDPGGGGGGGSGAAAPTGWIRFSRSEPAPRRLRALGARARVPIGWRRAGPGRGLRAGRPAVPPDWPAHRAPDGGDQAQRRGRGWLRLCGSPGAGGSRRLRLAWSRGSRRTPAALRRASARPPKGTQAACRRSVAPSLAHLRDGQCLGSVFLGAGRSSFGARPPKPCAAPAMEAPRRQLPPSRAPRSPARPPQAPSPLVSPKRPALLASALTSQSASA